MERSDLQSTSRPLVVYFFSYGPTSVEEKRTHNCGMEEKGLFVRDTPCLVLVSSQSLLAALARYREKNRLLAVKSTSADDRRICHSIRPTCPL